MPLVRDADTDDIRCGRLDPRQFDFDEVVVEDVLLAMFQRPSQLADASLEVAGVVSHVVPFDNEGFGGRGHARRGFFEDHACVVPIQDRGSRIADRAQRSVDILAAVTFENVLDPIDMAVVLHHVMAALFQHAGEIGNAHR